MACTHLSEHLEGQINLLSPDDLLTFLPTVKRLSLCVSSPGFSRLSYWHSLDNKTCMETGAAKPRLWTWAWRDGGGGGEGSEADSGKGWGAGKLLGTATPLWHSGCYENIQKQIENAWP